MAHIEQIPAYLTWKIRHRVMYPDMDFASVILPDDEDGVHLGLFAENKLVSVVSAFVRGGSMRFRKFATLGEFQRQGYGSELLSYLLDYARSQHISLIWCRARYSARGFYEKFGFNETDQRSENKGIAYVIMQRLLEPGEEMNR